jgi:hypothetical protein
MLAIMFFASAGCAHLETFNCRRETASMKRFVSLLVAVVAVCVIGCATNQMVQLSPDTYMIVKEDAAGIFGSMAKLKTDVIRQANAFAAKQGKIAVPLATNEKPVGFGPGQWASFEYQFRVVDKNDPEAVRTSLIPRANVVIDNTSRVSIDGSNPTQPRAAERSSPDASESSEISIESSVPNADVFIDGKFVGNAPLPKYRLSTGLHLIEVRAPGYDAWKRELSVSINASSRVIAQLEKSQE